MCRPTSVEPVKAIRSTPGCWSSASPAPGPSPVTTLTTPGGSSSKARAIIRLESGFWWGGLATTVFPAARAGATFQAISSSG